MSLTSLLSFSRSLTCGLAALTLLGMPACSSRPERPSREEMEARHALLKHLKGSSDFLEGALHITVSLDPAEDAGFGGPAGKGGKGGPHGGSGRRRPDGGGEGGPGGGGPRGGGDEEGESRPPIGALAEANNPPLRFQLTLENKGPEPLELHDVELLSAIGDFTVRPAKITLAPGASLQSEPMITRLGIPENDLTVSVKLVQNKVHDEKPVHLLVVTP